MKLDAETMSKNILNGEVKTIENNDIVFTESLINNLVNELKENYTKTENVFESGNYHNMVDNFIHFIMENFPDELVEFTFRKALSNVDFSPQLLDSWDEFVEKYGDMILPPLVNRDEIFKTDNYVGKDVVDKIERYWYKHDGVEYALTGDGKILDEDGKPLNT